MCCNNNKMESKKLVKHVCPTCFKIFGSKKLLNRHLNKKLSCDRNTDKYKFQCEHCMYKCQKRCELTTHIKNKGCCHYSSVNIENKKNVINSNNKQITNGSHNKIIENSNNQININLNKYVKIVEYGKEKKSFMSEKEILHFLFMGVMSIPEVVKFIHFNKAKPEFHNIYISNIRSEYACKFDGEQWNLCDKDDAIEEEFNRACDFLENMYDEYKNKGKLGELTIEKMDKFMVRKDKPDYMENMAAKILLVLYNNRHMVEDTIRNNDKLFKK